MVTSYGSTFISTGLTKLLQNENPPNVTLAKAAELSPIFLKNCNHIVDKICEHIEENFPANVGKIKNFIQVSLKLTTGAKKNDSINVVHSLLQGFFKTLLQCCAMEVVLHCGKRFSRLIQKYTKFANFAGLFLGFT